MKKNISMIVCSMLLLSSCSSYTATGSYTGASFGNVIGSAIGGLTGGWRGHELGSLIGTVGGAAVGAAIGQAAENSQKKKAEAKAAQQSARHQRTDDVIYDANGGHDDRISFPATAETAASPLQIRNAHVIDSNHDGVLTRGEECTVVFDILNTSDRPVYNIVPLVSEVSRNKHVNVSPSLRVESINAHSGVRYSATILADNRLKDGEIVISVGVAQGQDEITSQTRELKITTHKK